MNWYPRYFGDYMKKTSHLSLAEHGAYVVLLDHYYGTEQPLQADVTALIRVCRAFDQAEQKAVESVCNQFFPIGLDGLRHNKRADAEIAKGRAISGVRSSAGAKGAKARKQKHEEGPSKSTSNCLTNAKANGVSIAATPTPTTTVTSTCTTTAINSFAISGENDSKKQQIPSDVLLDCLASIDGDVSQLTKSAIGRAAKALSQIKDVCPNLTPEEIQRRSNNYKTHFDGCALTTTALAKHWAKCDKARPQSTHGNPSSSLYREADRVMPF